MRTFSPFLLVVLGACSFQASCGGKQLNMDNAKAFLERTFERETGEKPSAVSCPKSVDISKGKTFECSVSWGPAVATVTIVQDDDEGNVTIQASRGILVARTLESQIVEGIGKQTNVHVTASCGPRVRPAAVGDKFTCEVVDAKGNKGVVAVEVKGDHGAVDWKLQ